MQVRQGEHRWYCENPINLLWLNVDRYFSLHGILSKKIQGPGDLIQFKTGRYGHFYVNNQKVIKLDKDQSFVNFLF